VAAAEEQRRRRDVHAHDEAAVRAALQRERVVDLGGFLVVDREGGRRGLGKLARDRRARRTPRSRCHAGKCSKAKRRRKNSSGPESAPAAASSLGGASPAVWPAWSSARHSRLVLSGLKSSVSMRGAIASGTRPAASSAAHASTCSLLSAALLDPGERGLEVLLRRRLVASLAALVEVDRIGRAA
jgi:hypothetical protein